MARKNALGRGLGALIEGVEKEILERKVEANQDILIDSIDGNPFQPRTSFDEQAMEELAASPPASPAPGGAEGGQLDAA